MKDKIHASVEALNKPGFYSTAAISTMVELSGERAYVDAQVVISDCSRSIALDFRSDHEDERENSLHKIDTLIRTLSEFKEGLLKAHDIMREKKYKIALKGDDRDFSSSERERIIREYEEFHSKHLDKF